MKVPIKICGLIRTEDVELAQALGAWALGFIFYDQSPRYVNPKVVGEILTGLKIKPAHAENLSVGVFVNPSMQFLLSAVDASKVSAIQLHGEETPEFCAEVKNKFSRLKIFKALKPRVLEDIQEASLYKVCDGLLVDSYCENLKGGTGIVSRWDLARRINEIYKNLPPLILAGGLNEDNIVAALREVRPFAVDVSSSLEISPGIKSHDKMKSFFERSRQ